MAEFRRGEVWLVNLPADDPAKRGELIPKYVVLVQDRPRFGNKNRMSVVLATRNQRGSIYPWHVVVAKGRFSAWPVETLITCADIYSLPVADIKAGKCVGTLSADVMERVDLALVVSLGLGGSG